MKEYIRYITEEGSIGEAYDTAESMSKFITAPGIKMIDIADYPGLDKDLGFIHITTCPSLGNLGVIVSIRDDEGNLIERGPAIENPYQPDEWCYSITNCIPSYTSIVISVKAIDCIGGIAVQNAYLTIL